ncbi:MAG: hypothetical protein K6D92_04490 [Erysipelotrichaceae bacterium]|nr:hypothetical protein [Erysipelotrichaceae bacterium]
MTNTKRTNDTENNRIDIDLIDGIAADLRTVTAQVLALEMIEAEPRADLGDGYRSDYLRGVKSLLESITKRYDDLAERL